MSSQLQINKHTETHNHHVLLRFHPLLQTAPQIQKLFSNSHLFFNLIYVTLIPSTGLCIQSSIDLVKEITSLETEIAHLERYLLSLYRTAFYQRLHSIPTNEGLIRHPTIPNSSSKRVGSKSEANGIGKAKAKMVMAVSCAKSQDLTLLQNDDQKRNRELISSKRTVYIISKKHQKLALSQGSRQAGTSRFRERDAKTSFIHLFPYVTFL